MKKLIFILFLIQALALSGQTGFIKSYQYKDSLRLWFQNILYDELNNELVIAGLTHDPVNFQFGVYVARMDTFGNIVKEKLLLDSLGDHYPLNSSQPIIQTKDGGFILSTSLFFRNWGVVIKLNADLEQEFVREYIEEENILNTIFSGIVEVDDGYIIHARKQHDTYRPKPHLIKIDKQGELIWEKEYGSDNISYGTRIYQSSFDNGLILYGVEFDKFEIGGYYKGIIMKLDTSGKILDKEIIYSNDLPFYQGVEALIKTSNKNWLISAPLGYSYEPNFPGDEQLNIKSLDPDFNELWHTDIEWDGTTDEYSQIYTLSEDREGNILASGNFVTPDYLVNPSLLVKLSAEGEILWTRKDSIHYTPFDEDHYPATNKTMKHVVLPSGSIVLCGNSETDGPPYGNSVYGYIMKLDANGCLQPGCRETINTEELSSASDLIVYPNPFTGKFRVQIPEGLSGKLVVLNINGRLMKEVEVKLNTLNIQVDITTLPDGNYLIEFTPDKIADQIFYGSQILKLSK